LRIIIIIIIIFPMRIKTKDLRNHEAGQGDMCRLTSQRRHAQRRTRSAKVSNQLGLSARLTIQIGQLYNTSVQTTWMTLAFPLIKSDDLLCVHGQIIHVSLAKQRIDIISVSGQTWVPLKVHGP
jgi:hypothetical protein